MADTHDPQGYHDPAGSTQMFRAFVDEAPQSRQADASGGSRIGLIVGVVVALAVIAAVAWLALK